jgi:hypothetical protein
MFVCLFVVVSERTIIFSILGLFPFFQLGVVHFSVAACMLNVIYCCSQIQFQLGGHRINQSVMQSPILMQWKESLFESFCGRSLGGVFCASILPGKGRRNTQLYLKEGDVCQGRDMDSISILLLLFLSCL